MSRDLTQKSGSCLTLGGRHVKEDLSGVQGAGVLLLTDGPNPGLLGGWIGTAHGQETMLSTRRSRGPGAVCAVALATALASRGVWWRAALRLTHVRCETRSWHV